MLGSIKYWVQTNFGSKKFWVQKNYGSNKFWVLKNVWSKHKFGPKNFWYNKKRNKALCPCICTCVCYTQWHFFVGGGGGDNDDDGEEEGKEQDVSEANIFASKASKLSAENRNLWGPYCPYILIHIYYMTVAVKFQICTVQSFIVAFCCYQVSRWYLQQKVQGPCWAKLQADREADPGWCSGPHSVWP